MYKFWYDYVKQKCDEKCVKAGYIYKGIAEDVGTRFDTLNYELPWPLR